MFEPPLRFKDIESGKIKGMIIIASALSGSRKTYFASRLAKQLGPFIWLAISCGQIRVLQTNVH